MARPSKVEQDKKQLDTFSDEALNEVARFLGVELDESLDKEQKIAVLIKAKTATKVTLAKIVGEDGKEIDCPVGYAIIKVHPKSGDGYGEWSRETLFMNVQGDVCVLRRGVPVRVKEKFLYLLRNTSWTEVVQTDPGIEGIRPGKLEHRKVQSETFDLLAHNPDVELAERTERDLVARAEEYQKTKRSNELLKASILNSLVSGN